MDAEQVAALRAVLAPTGWLERTTVFARALRRSRTPGGLLVVGTPGTSRGTSPRTSTRRAGCPAPRTLPHSGPPGPPPDAPPHLRIGIRRLERAERGETVLVVGAETAPASLLERVSDARKRATVLALDQGDPELEQLAHEVLTVQPGRPRCPSAAHSIWSARQPAARPS